MGRGHVVLSYFFFFQHFYVSCHVVTLPARIIFWRDLVSNVAKEKYTEKPKLCNISDKKSLKNDFMFLFYF